VAADSSAYANACASVIARPSTSLGRGELTEQLPRFLQGFSTEGRKLNVHIMLLDQC